MLKWLGRIFSGSGKVAEAVGSPLERESARLRYRVEAAMNYVRVDEKSGEYRGITNQRQAKEKLHFLKRIFDAS